MMTLVLYWEHISQRNVKKDNQNGWVKWHQQLCKGKGRYSSSWGGTPPQSYGMSLAIWDHTVLPATWHKWMRPA